MHFFLLKARILHFHAFFLQKRQLIPSNPFGERKNTAIIHHQLIFNLNIN